LNNPANEATKLLSEGKSVLVTWSRSAQRTVRALACRQLDESTAQRSCHITTWTLRQLVMSETRVQSTRQAWGL
jgi:hypothetical protein